MVEAVGSGAAAAAAAATTTRVDNVAEDSREKKNAVPACSKRAGRDRFDRRATPEGENGMGIECASHAVISENGMG